MNRDFWAVVCFDADGVGYIIAQSEHSLKSDLLMEQTTDDNNMHFFDSLGDEVYPTCCVVYCDMKPYATHDTHIGDFDAGIDCYIRREYWNGEMLIKELVGE